MSYTLYDYLNGHGVNAFREWTEGLQKRDRVRLNQKLDMLQQHGTTLPPKLLSDTGVAHIKKIRITGKKVPTLRPMLCMGPINNDKEFTLLQGAIEQDRRLVPGEAISLAVQHREIVVNDPRRRCPHERIS